MPNTTSYLNSLKPITKAGSIAGNIHDDQVSKDVISTGTDVSAGIKNANLNISVKDKLVSTRALKDNLGEVTKYQNKTASSIDGYFLNYYQSVQKYAQTASDEERSALADLNYVMFRKGLSYEAGYEDFKENILKENGKDLSYDKKYALMKHMNSITGSYESPFTSFNPRLQKSLIPLNSILNDVNNAHSMFEYTNKKVKKVNTEVFNDLEKKYTTNYLEEGQSIQSSGDILNQSALLDPNNLKALIIKQAKQELSSGFMIDNKGEFTAGGLKVLKQVEIATKRMYENQVKERLNQIIPEGSFVYNDQLKFALKYANTQHSLNFTKAIEELKNEYLETYETKPSIYKDVKYKGEGTTAVPGYAYETTLDTSIPNDGYETVLDLINDTKQGNFNVKFGKADADVSDAAAKLIFEELSTQILHGAHLPNAKGVYPKVSYNGKLTMQNVAANDENKMGFTMALGKMWLMNQPKLAKYLEDNYSEDYQKIMSGEVEDLSVIYSKDNANSLFYLSTLPSTEDVLLNDPEGPGLNLKNTSGSSISIKKEADAYNLNLNLRYIAGVDEEGKLVYDELNQPNQTIAFPEEGLFDGKLVYNKYDNVLRVMQQLNYEILVELRKRKNKSFRIGQEDIQVLLQQRLGEL
jgi:hypothetical protein